MPKLRYPGGLIGAGGARLEGRSIQRGSKLRQQRSSRFCQRPLDPQPDQWWMQSSAMLQTALLAANKKQKQDVIPALVDLQFNLLRNREV